MGNEKTIDYLKAVRDFDKSLGRKTDDFDMPLKSTAEADGGVDYLKVSREYEQYLATDQSEVVRNGKSGK